MGVVVAIANLRRRTVLFVRCSHVLTLFISSLLKNNFDMTAVGPSAVLRKPMHRKKSLCCCIEVVVFADIGSEQRNCSGTTVVGLS